MSQSEGWIITALGMVVVYIGLLLCIVFIQLFSRISKRISWGDAGHGAAPHGAAAATSALEPATAPVSREPIGADVLAVIATVLEVERTLYVSRPDFRLTIRRHVAQS
jgi:Na+-transporting methylmalonyl-CoA/oxaloacetate decarboxylase gamma subunit